VDGLKGGMTVRTIKYCLICGEDTLKGEGEIVDYWYCHSCLETEGDSDPRSGSERSDDDVS